MRVIVAIDPGETTGYVKAVVANAPPPAGPNLLFSPHLCGAFRTFDQLASLMAPVAKPTGRILIPGKPEATQAQAAEGLFDHTTDIVIEGYRIYPGKLQQHAGSDVPTLQMLGIVRWLHYTYCRAVAHGQLHVPLPTFHVQSASQAKQQWPKRRFRKHILNHYPIIQHGGVHTRDACRHLVTFLENNGIMKFFDISQAV